MMSPESHPRPCLVLNIDDIQFLMGPHFEPFFKARLYKGRCPHCRRKPARFVLQTCQLSSSNDVQVRGRCTICSRERHIQFEIGREFLCRERADFLRELRLL